MDIENFSLPVRDTITLRFIRPGEAEALFKLVDKNRAYLREWLDWVDGQTGPDVSREVILRRIEDAKTLKAFDLGVFDGEVLIGSMGFNQISVKSRRAEIGYWVSKDSEGQGIMTDCVRALTTYGFTELHLHRIEIHCSTRNSKSSAIPKKLGFTFEGILRDASFLYDHFEDSAIYSMLDREWTSKMHTTAKNS